MTFCTLQFSTCYLCRDWSWWILKVLWKCCCKSQTPYICTELSPGRWEQDEYSSHFSLLTEVTLGKLLAAVLISEMHHKSWVLLIFSAGKNRMCECAGLVVVMWVVGVHVFCCIETTTSEHWLPDVTAGPAERKRLAHIFVDGDTTAAASAAASLCHFQGAAINWALLFYPLNLYQITHFQEVACVT